jgi:hypothetical protein
VSDAQHTRRVLKLFFKVLGADRISNEEFCDVLKLAPHVRESELDQVEAMLDTGDMLGATERLQAAFMAAQS